MVGLTLERAKEGKVRPKRCENSAGMTLEGAQDEKVRPNSRTRTIWSDFWSVFGEGVPKSVGERHLPLPQTLTPSAFLAFNQSNRVECFNHEENCWSFPP